MPLRLPTWPLEGTVTQREPVPTISNPYPRSSTGNCRGHSDQPLPTKLGRAKKITNLRATWLAQARRMRAPLQKRKITNLRAAWLAQVQRMREPGWPRFDECEHLCKRENRQLESSLAGPSSTNASTSAKEKIANLRSAWLVQVELA